MITEKVFCRGFATFWQDLLPMLGAYVRSQNLVSERFAEPFRSELPASTHGSVNEMSFRLFMAARAAEVRVFELNSRAIEAAADAAIRQIREMRQSSRAPVRIPDGHAVKEAVSLAGTIEDFFDSREGPIATSPVFPGCGLLGECQGDVLGPSVLYELKAGDRTFRAEDVKQVICYAALSSATSGFDIQRICLVNPRRGTFVEDSLERLCLATAGASPLDVYADVLAFCTEMTERQD